MYIIFAYFYKKWKFSRPEFEDGIPDFKTIQMINYFKKLLTGYKTVKRNVNGREYKYFYSGKPLYFDPFALLREFQFRTTHVSVQRWFFNSSISEPISELPFPKESDQSSVICECTNNEKEFRTTRFSLKGGIHSVSFYRFELNGNQIETFRRRVRLRFPY